MLTVTPPEALAAPFIRPARPHAAVVGAGFGGLAAALRLAARGWRVTVCDRLDHPGGRATARRQDGFRFDLGPTIVTAPHILEELFAAGGKRMSDYVDIVPMNPFYTIRWPDGSHFTASGDEDRMRDEVRRLSPDDVAGWERFMRDAERRYEVGFVGLGRRPLHELWELIKVLPSFAWLRADRSIHALAARRMRDPRLRMAFSFHPLFIGGDPFRVTSMYALVSHLEKLHGVHYAMGGAGALAQGIADAAEELGVEFRWNADVDEIVVEGDRAAGVRLASGEIVSADIVVSNADAGHTYSALLSGRSRKRWTDARLKRSKWSMGLYVWYFGTRGTAGRFPKLGHHTILNGPRYGGLVDDVFVKGTLAEDMSLYIHRPSVTDPSCAPEGDDAWYALSPVPHLGHDRPVDWQAQGARYREAVLAQLETLAPGIGETVVSEHVMTPEDFRTRYRSPYGAGFSIEPRILQSAWFRPHNISEEVEGLYLVGAGTHPGAGLPGAICSAEVADQLIPAAETVEPRA
ncbi:MAG: phytoene desaturase [Pseudomonadota bacterium]